MGPLDFSVVLDFETASSTDLKKAGAWRYAECPTTEILCLAFSLAEGEPQLWAPARDGIQIPEPLATYITDKSLFFIAHNAGFEKAIWRRILVEQYGWPDVPNSRWHDTMAMCAMKMLPQDLERALTVLRLPHQKDKEGSNLTKSLSKPDKAGNYDRRPGTLERVYEYCRSDIRGEVDVHSRLGWLPPGERSVWLLDQRINERGVRLDRAFIKAANEVVAKASLPLLGEFAEITGGLKPTQTEKFKDWCYHAGVPIPNLKAETLKAMLEDEDEDAEDQSLAGDEVTWEAEYPDLPEHVHRALSIRKLIGSASIKKLTRMEHCICADDRARGLLQYHGTGPGLWAGRLFQPQNFPRGTLQLDGRSPPPQLLVDAIMTGDPAYVEMLFGPAIDAVVHSLRHCIVANPDRILVAADLSGIQARTVLALAGQYDKTAIMAAGQDIYIDMAKSIYGREDLNKKEHPEERQTGKNSVLGLGFQMGAAKFRARYAKKHPLDFAQRVVDTYRQEWAPLVPKLWYGLQEAACKAVWDRTVEAAYGIEYRLEDMWLTARLPSGRKLWYPNPRPIRKPMPWDHLDVRPAWQYNAIKQGQWRTIDAFGGLLTENVVMGIQRDLMVSAALRLERFGFPLVLNVHDEWIAEPEGKYGNVETFIEIMTDIPQWAKELQIPVAAEGWVGERYKKG